MAWIRCRMLILCIVTLLSSSCAFGPFSVETAPSVNLFVSAPSVGITRHKFNIVSKQLLSTTVLVPSTSTSPRPQGVSAAFLSGRLWIAWNESDRKIMVCAAPCADPSDQHEVDTTTRNSTSPSLLSVNGVLVLSWAVEDRLKFASSSDGATWNTFKDDTYDQHVGPTALALHNGHIFAAFGFYQPMSPPSSYGALNECPREIVLMRIEIGSPASHGEFRVPVAGCNVDVRNGVSLASDGSQLTVGFIRRSYPWLIRSDASDGDTLTWSLPAQQLYTPGPIDMEVEHRVNLAPVIAHSSASQISSPTLGAINKYKDVYQTPAQVDIFEIGSGGQLGAYWSGQGFSGRVYGVDLKIFGGLQIQELPIPGRIP